MIFNYYYYKYCTYIDYLYYTYDFYCGYYMENTNMTIVAAVLVVGLLVGAGVGYYMAPSGAGDGGPKRVVYQGYLDWESF